jgi:3-phosphoshikimate 1-carboxyvinyltransferase
MIAPVLEKGLIIRINGDLVSKPYIDTTINIMQDFGINVQNDDYSIFTIKGGQKYKNKNYTVPGDASSASYFMAATATCGGKIKIKNVGSACNQGDIHFAYLLKQMGAEVKIKKYSTVIKSNGNLNGICVDLNNTPDIVQTLIATALFAKGETTITNVSNLRIKETDRLKALENELKKIGAEVETGNDWIKIMPSKNYKACEIETYDDHRMAMSFAITGLKINGIKIKDSEVVSKSFPNFWDLFDSLNI